MQEGNIFVAAAGYRFLRVVKPIACLCDRELSQRCLGSPEAFSDASGHREGHTQATCG